MKTLLVLLIATYLLSGFVSTQVSLPAETQVPIRIIIAGLLALPFLSFKRLKGLSARSVGLCFSTAFAGYIVGAWAFSYAIALGGYSIAVFITSLPWLGLIEFLIRGEAVNARDRGVLALSTVGGVVFFAPTLSFGSEDGYHTSSIIWSMVAAMAGTFAQYGRRLHRSNVSSAAVADWVIVSAVLQALVMIGTVEVDLQGGDLLWLLVGGGCYFASNRLSNFVFAAVSPTLAAVWMSTEPIVALILSALFLGVWPSVWQCTGGSLLLIAAFSQYGFATDPHNL
jgi:drug/metabolite transporter (DMT)-like permease